MSLYPENVVRNNGCTCLGSLGGPTTKETILFVVAPSKESGYAKLMPWSSLSIYLMFMIGALGTNFKTSKCFKILIWSISWRSKRQLPILDIHFWHCSVGAVPFFPARLIPITFMSCILNLIEKCSMIFYLLDSYQCISWRIWFKPLDIWTLSHHHFTSILFIQPKTNCVPVSGCAPW